MDAAVTTIDLSEPARAAASDGTTVWCAEARGVRAYTASGTPHGKGDESDTGGAGREGAAGRGRGAGREDGARLPELWSLAAVPGTVTGAGVPGMLAETVMMPRSFAGTSPVHMLRDSLPEGTLAGASRDRVYWLGPSGVPLASVPFEGRVLAGGGEIWAVGADRACRLAEPGRLHEPVELPDLDLCAVEGERLWWTSKRDTVLRGGPREVDLGRRERGGMAVCAGSLWVSVTGGLLRVSAWSGEPRRFVGAPEGPVPYLACAHGVLAGGLRDLFTLAPATGADARLVRLGLQTPLALMIAAGKHLWAFPADRPQALIIPL
ncbi:hypothetical protein [Nonomuraea sp. NPDC050643]|uniref:hypothetical protein n=1 Tax=Nonomuraea sp. NPDC050643 TaxID=3155660 RepID=UPI0033F0EA56